jgi:hypothetical protein
VSSCQCPYVEVVTHGEAATNPSTGRADHSRLAGRVGESDGRLSFVGWIQVSWKQGVHGVLCERLAARQRSRVVEVPVRPMRDFFPAQQDGGVVSGFEEGYKVKPSMPLGSAVWIREALAADPGGRVWMKAPESYYISPGGALIGTSRAAPLNLQTRFKIERSRTISQGPLHSQTAVVENGWAGS